ncbi:MAG: baseplate J/gp47 family protein [Brevundimonas sp.]|uniref:baseplate assembly protein n=1 Tax=Brevundimonas sp. TaxID=1871086 RepID=UPI002725403F|nr:baseplate J/gp47 family protein [Brevundimonas sp.]MDO9607219.1 baseplate J/gp47 family protein [Brevundimonas sp.]
MSTTAVNLSGLPMPAVVEILSVEEIIADAKAQLIALEPALETFLQLESDPLVKLIQVFALREFALRQRVNDASRANMLAYAVGSDLDHRGAEWSLARLVLVPANVQTGAAAVMESDDDFRERILLAPEALSVAGPEGAYRSLARNASGDVLDASCTSPSAGVVVVTVLSRDDDGVPSAALLDLVSAAVSSDSKRPLTDQVLVSPAEVLTYDVNAELTTFPGPDAEVVRSEALARLKKYTEDSFRLGRDVTLAKIYAALGGEGVQDVTLIAPPATIVTSDLQAARCASITLTHAGTDT